MEKKIVNISIKPEKLVIFLAIIVGIGAIIFFIRFNSGGNPNNPAKNKQEIILPLKTGVADSGFETTKVDFSTLNAEASYDSFQKIDGAYSLRVAFSKESTASIRIKSYLNEINEEDFYRLGFWVKSDSNEDKRLIAYIAEKEKVQDLGKFSLNKNENIKYVEFNFQASNSAEDLIFTSSDGISGNIWIDNVTVEKINVSSFEELKKIKTTVFGNTVWNNVDQSQTKEGGDSSDFFSNPGRKIGQIFNPSSDLLSGVAFRILRHGTGATGGAYQLQLREFDEKLGEIANEPIASVDINIALKPEAVNEINEKEKQMRDDFQRNEKEIKDIFLEKEQNITAGKIENNQTANHYPDTFTQDQIDAANAARRTAQAAVQAAKRATQLEIDIKNMKESFNTTEELEIPLATKIDPNKKYWIGIDNSKAVVDQNNFISIAIADTEEKGDGIASEISGVWKKYPSFWFKTFYPIHQEIENNKIPSGATISDVGRGKFIYRYRFASSDYLLLSGFSGRKVYDISEGLYENIDNFGNWQLADDGYVTYKFDTLHPVKKVIIREAIYDQCMAIEFSPDGNNWEDIFSDNPVENNQKINPISFTPEKMGNTFFLKFMSNGDGCSLKDLSVEAELAGN